MHHLKSGKKGSSRFRGSASRSFPVSVQLYSRTRCGVRRLRPQGPGPGAGERPVRGGTPAARPSGGVRGLPPGRAVPCPATPSPPRGSSAPQDLIIHVRDVTHPETELQKASVLSSLHGLRLPTPLLDSMLEVHNKTDLVPG